MTRAILLFGREQHRLLIFAGSNVMKTIYLIIGLVMLGELSGCARPIVESNYQKTQPLLTQMLCPMCDVPSLKPPAPIIAKAPQPVEYKTISTVDNPAPTTEPVPENSPTIDTTIAPVDTAPQPVNLPSPAPSKPPVIILDMNAPDLGISAQSAPTPAPPAAVPPQSKLDDEEDDDDEENTAIAQLSDSKQESIQLSEADIHNAQDVHELTVRLMNMSQ